VIATERGKTLWKHKIATAVRRHKRALVRHEALGEGFTKNHSPLLENQLQGLCASRSTAVPFCKEDSSPSITQGEKKKAKPPPQGKQHIHLNKKKREVCKSTFAGPR